MSGDWNPSAEPHEVWRRRRILEGQRYRRSKYRRIDYYPSQEAADIIDALLQSGPGGDLSSVISRIVSEWGEAQSDKFPE